MIGLWSLYAIILLEMFIWTLDAWTCHAPV